VIRRLRDHRAGAALRQLNKRVRRTLLAELLGTPTKVDPGFRGGLSREPAHRAEGICRPDFNAEATEAINDDRVLGDAPSSKRIARGQLARRLWLMTFDSDGVRLIQINAGLARARKLHALRGSEQFLSNLPPALSRGLGAFPWLAHSLAEIATAVR
jgi:hypothetical protein